MMIRPRDFSVGSIRLNHLPSFCFVLFFVLLPRAGLSLPSPVRHGLPPAGDVLLPEQRRGDRVRGLLPAGAVRGPGPGQRGAQPPVRCFTNCAKAQRIQKTRTVPAAEARVLLADPLHHQWL